MLFLFNKAKIISYIVSIFTVIALFFAASSLTPKDGAVEVATNTVKMNSNIIR